MVKWCWFGVVSGQRGKWRLPSGSFNSGAFRPHANRMVLGPWQTTLPQFHELEVDAGFSHPKANMWWAISAFVRGSTLAFGENRMRIEWDLALSESWNIRPIGSAYLYIFDRRQAYNWYRDRRRPWRKKAQDWNVHPDFTSTRPSSTYLLGGDIWHENLHALSTHGWQDDDAKQRHDHRQGLETGSETSLSQARAFSQWSHRIGQDGRFWWKWKAHFLTKKQQKYLQPQKSARARKSKPEPSANVDESKLFWASVENYEIFQIS